LSGLKPASGNLLKTFFAKLSYLFGAATAAAAAAVP
jgi:hypothetical protein